MTEGAKIKVFMVKSNNLANLANLLSAKQPLFDLAISNLEALTDHQQKGVLLQKEIDKAFSNFVKRHLEVSESEGEAVYKALMKLIWEQNEIVASKYLKLEEEADLDQTLQACIDFVEKMKLPKRVFRLKKQRAIQMLEDNPPLQVLKLLKYNNVTEMLAKERLEEVYGALRFAEGDEWLAKFNEQYLSLKAEDFTYGEIEIVKMPLRWAPLTKDFIKKKKHNITHLKELGVVVVIETEDRELLHGLVLKVLPLIVHYFYEVRLYSNFFKLKSKSTQGAEFGRVITETILADPKLDVKIGGERIHWRVVQRYFGKLEDAKKHPEIFEPHLQPEDLHWDRAEKILAEVIPELMIWEELDYVGRIYDGLPISLNFMDLTLGFANKARYKEHLFYHFRESLWNEIFARYMGHDALEDELLAKLNNSLVMPERLNPTTSR